MNLKVVVDEPQDNGRFLEVEIAPDGATWDLFNPTTAYNRDGGRRLRLDSAHVILGNDGETWRIRSIRAFGYVVLKSGRVSRSTRDRFIWRGQGRGGEYVATDDYPQWVAEVAEEIRRATGHWPNPEHSKVHHCPC